MAIVVFAAKVVKVPGDPRLANEAPARLEAPWACYVVVNPFTGRLLWLTPSSIVNIVNDVATVRISANWSGRLSKMKRGFREFINPLTGNTFQVRTAAIIKETS